MKSARKSVRLKRQRNGELRKHWYGQYVEDDKHREINLNVEWQGAPPASGKWSDPGDGDFEASRKEAEAALAAHVEEARHKGRADHLTERLIESKTGHKVKYARLDALPSLYRKRAKANGASKDHLARNCDPCFNRFIELMRTRNPEAEYLYQVSADDAAAFVEVERAIFAKGTAQASIRRVSNTFAAFLPVGAANPFAQFKGSHTEGEVIHREPFTPEQLTALLDAARPDPFMYPLIVAAACTGARQADVCHLKWSAVDLAGGMIAVKTRKTGKPVEIPIFAPLREVLESIPHDRSGFVFPEAAEVYANSRHKLGREFKQLVVKSIEGDTSPTPPPRVPLADVLDEGLEAIESEYRNARGERMAAHFRRYCEGESVRDIEAATGCPRSTVSADLHAVQDMIGKQFMPPKQAKSKKAAVARLTRLKRPDGSKSASVKDWHALRTTFVTLALSAGVPVELVKRVTGHATVEVVLQHYFRPDREQFRSALTIGMPDVLTGKTKPKRLKPADELAALVSKVQSGTATDTDKKRLRTLAAKV